jgi:sec-independent protein translocase protein TatC
VENFKEFIARFTPYLEDIRKRLYVMAIFFAVSFGIGFLSTSIILKGFLSFFELKGVVIATTSPFQFADLSIDIGLLAALFVCTPALIYHFFAFLRPALSKRERKMFFLLIPISLILFLSGFLYGFFILYYALVVLAKINVTIGIQNIWDIGMFLSQIVLTATFLGVLFEFPILCTYIIRTGLFNVELLKKKRRLAIFTIFVFATLLPPTDGISLLAMALPLVLLYEITIFVNSKVLRTKTSN